MAVSARRSTPRSLTAKSVAGGHGLLSRQHKHRVLAGAGGQAGFVRVRPAMAEHLAVKVMAHLLDQLGAGWPARVWGVTQAIAAHAAAAQPPGRAPSPGPRRQPPGALLAREHGHRRLA